MLCLEINERNTKKMFSKFKEIYKDKKYRFDIADNNKKDITKEMINIIINYTKNNFEGDRKKRNDDRDEDIDNSENETNYSWGLIEWRLDRRQMKFNIL